MLKLKIFVILFAIMLQINGDTCGGANCPTGKCPTCYCGRQQHLVDIATIFFPTFICFACLYIQQAVTIPFASNYYNNNQEEVIEVDVDKIKDINQIKRIFWK